MRKRERAAVRVRKIVDDGDGVPRAHELDDRVRSDVAEAAGHEDPPAPGERCHGMRGENATR